MGAGTSVESSATRNSGDSSSPQLEFAGMLVSRADAEALLSQVAGDDGEVSRAKLLRYLHAQGLPANQDEVEEMIKMLSPSDSNDDALPAASNAHSATLDATSAESASSSQAFGSESGVNSAEQSLDDELWQAFLNRSFTVGEAMLSQGLLEREAIEQREAFVFVALPALTFLDVVINDQSNGESISFGRGVSVSPSSAPPEWQPIITSLCHARRLLLGATSSDATLVNRLRLSCAADPEEGYAFDDATADADLTQIRGQLQSAATAATQTDRFKENYESVFELISSIAAGE